MLGSNEVAKFDLIYGLNNQLSNGYDLSNLNNAKNDDFIVENEESAQQDNS